MLYILLSQLFLFFSKCCTNVSQIICIWGFGFAEVAKKSVERAVLSLVNNIT